jgi:hypothetical protein
MPVKRQALMSPIFPSKKLPIKTPIATEIIIHNALFKYMFTFFFPFQLPNFILANFFEFVKRARISCGIVIPA